MKSDIVVIGGGPAGLASAYQASKQGASVILIERDYRLGGVLNQCIHNGFGLHYFGEELTGPEYAQRWIDKLAETKTKVVLNSMVMQIQKLDEQKIIIQITNEDGVQNIECKAVILAMGCRERTGSAINLCGSRPAGIFLAGEAQRLVNTQGKMVGKNVVILGSGDVGLIMARRLTCEGAKVLGVYEVMPTCGGLARNISQCLNDFNIPLHLSTSVVKVIGKKRVEGVYVAPVNSDFSFDLSKQEFIPCDTLLLSVGLIPETELLSSFDIELSKVTSSAVINEYNQTTIPEIFICGNVMHVNDLVDNVTNESIHAGDCAVKFINNELNTQNKIEIIHDEHIRYTAPKYIYKDNNKVDISFRVDKEYKKVAITAYSNNEKIATFGRPVVRAGEMEKITLDKSKITTDLVLKLEVL